MFNEPFVQLKINNQALESAFTPVSPGEVFKVFGSQRLHTIIRLLSPLLWFDQQWQH